MLRKIFLSCPWQALDAFVGGARETVYEIDDSGWYQRGRNIYELEGLSGPAVPEEERVGFVSLVFDDATHTRKQVYDAMCAAAPGIEVEVGACVVFMPDGLDADWYDMVWSFAQTLHAAEEKAYGPNPTAADLALVTTLREALQPVLDQGIQESNEALAEWAQKVGEAIGEPLLAAMSHRDALALIRLRLQLGLAGGLDWQED